MLSEVNYSIHNFSDLKSKSFRVKFSFEMPNRTKQEVEKAQSFFAITDNKEIQLIQLEFILAWLRAGAAYTPFFLPKISTSIFLFYLTRKITKFFAEIHLKEGVKSYLTSILWLSDEYAKYPDYKKKRNDISAVMPLRN